MEKQLIAIQKVWNETQVPLNNWFEGMFTTHILMEQDKCEEVQEILEHYGFSTKWEADKGFFRFIYGKTIPIVIMVQK